MSSEVALAGKGAAAARYRAGEGLDTSVNHLVSLDVRSVGKGFEATRVLADVGLLSRVDADVSL